MSRPTRPTHPHGPSCPSFDPPPRTAPRAETTTDSRSTLRAATASCSAKLEAERSPPDRAFLDIFALARLCVSLINSGPALSTAFSTSSTSRRPATTGARAARLLSVATRCRASAALEGHVLGAVAAADVADIALSQLAMSAHAERRISARAERREADAEGETTSFFVSASAVRGFLATSSRPAVPADLEARRASSSFSYNARRATASHTRSSLSRSASSALSNATKARSGRLGDTARRGGKVERGRERHGEDARMRGLRGKGRERCVRGREGLAGALRRCAG